MESQSRGILISLCPRRSWILILNLILVCPNVDAIVSGQPSVPAFTCIYLYLRTHCSTPRIFFQGTRIWVWFWTESTLPRIFQGGGGKAASWKTRFCWGKEQGILEPDCLPLNTRSRVYDPGLAASYTNCSCLGSLISKTKQIMILNRLGCCEN